MKILKKLSVATVCSLDRKFFRELKSETAVMRIFGVTRGYVTGEGAFGPFLKFVGEFKAIDLGSGEEAIGSAAYLPSPIDALLAVQIDALKQDGKAVSVEFAFDIAAKPSEKAATGYEYVVHSLTETRVSDPLALLSSTVAALPSAVPSLSKVEQPGLALEAPKAADKVDATEKAPKSKKA